MSSTESSKTGALDEIPADADMIETLFQEILGRPVGNDPFKAKVAGEHSIQYWIHRLMNSEEFMARYLQRHQISSAGPEFIADAEFRNPHFGTLPAPDSVIVVGSCMTEPWPDILKQSYPRTTIRHQLFNNASELETLSDEEVSRSAFQIVQIPLRSIISEADYFNAAVSPQGLTELQQAFELAKVRLKINLDAAFKYNRQTGIPTFALNFAVPQRNPLGMLLPKYELSNLAYFIRELNRELYALVAEEKNAFLIDYDEVCASIGKRYIMDDVTHHFNHGSFIWGSESHLDIQLTPHGDPHQLFGAKVSTTLLAAFNECLAAYETISPTQKIKLAIFDLDGTLWRGVAAEHDELTPDLTEGWPLGVLEAAAFLKKRGIVLAIASKNDPTVVRKIWDELYEKRFPLSNFAVTKISWDPKVSAIGAILEETNLLPANCLFIDDNPLEREQVKRAYPDMHQISGPVLTWRRQLLWSVETQVPYITEESAGRTESIQSMIQREQLRTDQSDEDYISGLGVTARIEAITSPDHPRYARALELLNKTNQFNLTGERFTEQEMTTLLSNGGKILAADVSDRLSNYGLTAAIVMMGGECVQFVMSCRVFGLRIEYALFERFLAEAQSVQRRLRYVRAERNGPSRKLFEKLSFDLDGLDKEGDGRTFVLSADYRLPDNFARGITVFRG